MILRGPNFQVISKNSNTEYYSGALYPEWTPIAGIHDFPLRPMGSGVEPHYHDNDEFWLWVAGRGEVWLDGQNIHVGPNSVTYGPMGVVHKFLMHTDFHVVAVITRPERRQRSKHILVEEDGPPVPTVPGFVVPGDRNDSPFPARGARCPLSELRALSLPLGGGVPAATLAVNEHWLVHEGVAVLTVDGQGVELHQGDIALLRAGARRSLRAAGELRLVLARE